MDIQFIGESTLATDLLRDKGREEQHARCLAGYWRLGKDAIKVIRSSLSQLRMLIIDEVSMLSNLNLAYIVRSPPSR